jgi:hypothetical protein
LPHGRKHLAGSNQRQIVGCREGLERLSHRAAWRSSRFAPFPRSPFPVPHAVFASARKLATHMYRLLRWGNPTSTKAQTPMRSVTSSNARTLSNARPKPSAFN